MIILTFINGILDVNIINCIIVSVAISAIGTIIGLIIAGIAALISVVFTR